MQFNNHHALEGRHAFLSASGYHWLRYDADKLANKFRTHQAAAIGTRLHNVAAELIKLGIKQARSNKTLNLYVNDAIGFKMTPEQTLVYSINAFGTADAICFRNNKLRIHDLKTGVSPAHFDQLKIYAAFFCLEYGIKPAEIEIELRIYQNDEVSIDIPDFDEITKIMSLIVVFDNQINEMREEALV